MKRSLFSLFLLAGILGFPAMAFPADDGAFVLNAAAATATAAAPTQQAPTITLLQAIEGGGWAMVPLALMSVLTIMLVFAYAITLRRGAVVSRQFMNTAEVLLKEQDYSGLAAIANRQSEAVARIVFRTLNFARGNPDASFAVIREIAQTEGAARAASLQHRITYLADIAVLSPMVGLLGTVVGIIKSFATIAHSTSEVTRTGLLSGGVSEALFATAAGLIIGIVAMAFYGLYRNRVQALISELEGASAQLLGLMAVNFDKYRERREPRAGDRLGRKGAVPVDDDF